MDTLSNEPNILELDKIARQQEIEREIKLGNEMIWESWQNAMEVLSDKPHRIPRKTPHSMTMPPEPLWTPHKGEYKPKPNDTSYGTEPIIGIDPMLAAFITTIVFVLAIYIATHI